MKRKVVSFSTTFLLFVIGVRFSVGDNSLIGINVNLDPVYGLLKKDIPTTTVASTTTQTSTSSKYLSNRVNTQSCGKRIITHMGLITSGNPTKPGDWPWHVAIYKMKTVKSEQIYICGGTLVSHSRVITAGHCVAESGSVIVPERLFVVLGKYNLAGGDMASQEKGVFEIVLHPEFSFTTLTNDIAVLKLSSNVKYSDHVQPICLWGNSNTKKSDIVGKLGTVVGWGFTHKEKLASELTKAELPVKDDLNCVKSNPSFYSQFLTENTYCAGFGNGTSACNGDSGSGMFFPSQDSSGQDIWSLRGIVSLSVSRSDINRCDPNYYTVFTDVVQYKSFIEDHININN